MPYDRDGLIESIETEAVRYGDFVLASGKRSHFYVDCRWVTLSSKGAALIGAGILELLEREGDRFDAIGGLTLGADPIVAAVLTLAGLEGKSLRGFLVRKEAKGHGTGSRIEGSLEVGDRCVIVDDVATTGGSCVQALEAAREFGCEISRVVTVLDRRAGAAENFGKLGVPFSTLLTIDEIAIREPSPDLCRPEGTS